MITAEAYFLDVGQGASQVVLLPSGGAIVIDCGPAKSAHVLLRLLSTYLRGDIEVLAITHNDRDHDGGTERLLMAFAERIRKIAYLEDRFAHEIRTFSLVQKLRREGRFDGLELRLEYGSGYPPLYDAPGDKLRLSVLWPEFRAACGATTPNAMSGIVALECGERRVVFSGDAVLTAWQGLFSRLRGPLGCDVLSLPHHGASVGDDPWIYANAVKATYGVVSVGSCNQYSHPCASAIRAAVAAGVNVICTEITERCCDDLEELDGGILSPVVPSLCMHETGRNLPCAGTILAEISPDAVVLKPFVHHRTALKKLASCHTVKPLCL